MEAIPLVAALVVSFFAGLASFASPCVLPLVPSYLSFVTGMSLEDLQQGVDRRNTLTHSLLFVAGFSTIFVLLGATASFLGQFLKAYELWITRFGGLVIVGFGLHLMGLLQFSPLLRERRMQLQERPAGHIGSILIGMAFGAGWTPCLGPILGGILTFAGTAQHLGSGVGMLSAYSFGLAVPFVISALAMERFLEAFQSFRRHLRGLQFAAGALLLFVGLLLITGSFTVLTGYLYRLTPEFLLDFEYWMLERVKGV